MNYALIPGSQVSPRYLMLCGLSHGQPPRENVKYSLLAFVMQNGFKASCPPENYFIKNSRAGFSSRDEYPHF
jgi:hypothetical protein